MSTTLRYIAGGMSGTSADGVDVAICAIDGRGYDMTARLVVHHHRPYNAELRRQIFAFRSGGAGSVSQDTLRALAEMGREISLTYAAAVNEALAAAHMESKRLAAVAAHGQTLFHDPPNTIQWLDPALLAAEVGCAVVSDFRRADLAAGGQGAPLVPFADFILFRDATKNRVLLNIGGIANLTYLPAGASIDSLIAFDTGPGNCLSDQFIRNETSGEVAFDAGGERAMKGRVDEALANAALSHPFFLKPPPKSTDLPEMMDAFLLGYKVKTIGLNTEDILATACFITARAILKAVESLGQVDEVVASGGGTENAAIMRNLERGLGDITVRRTDELGVPSQAKEAIAFALLGASTLDGVPSNVPSVTGAKRPVVLGSITPRP